MPNEPLFYKTCKLLYENVDINGKQSPLIAPDLYRIISNNANKIENEINYNWDYNYDYKGFQLLYKTYLLKCHISGEWKQIERPQHMLMRVALAINFSTKYQDFNKLRTNDKAIWDNLQSVIPWGHPTLTSKIRQKWLD